MRSMTLSWFLSISPLLSIDGHSSRDSQCCPGADALILAKDLAGGKAEGGPSVHMREGLPLQAASSPRGLTETTDREFSDQESA